MLIKILLYFDVVVFLVKGLVAFILKRGSMIFNFRGWHQIFPIKKIRFMGGFTRSWIMLLEMVKVYDGEILYYPSKSNVVVDALSRKPASEPLQELCIRMIVFTSLLELIGKAREAVI